MKRRRFIGHLPPAQSPGFVHAALASLDRKIHARARLERAEINRGCDWKLHRHRRPADLRDGIMAQVHFVLGRIDGIDRAAAVGVVGALMSHSHFAAVLWMGGTTLAGRRSV
jgi:hypothetical protein